MKAVILIRVSSKEQEDNHSLDAQQEKLTAYCDQKGFEKPEVFRIVESSTQGERKKFNEMIKWINQQNELVYLVVDAVDRLQRSFKETIILTDMMKARKLELHFLKENLILGEDANPMQVMMWNFAVMCAQNFVLSSGYNIKRSNQRKLNNGEYIRQAPVGYRNYRDDNGRSQIRVDENRAYLVKEAFELYSTGNYSVSSLWKYLKEKKLTVIKKSERPLIGRASVARMLQDKFYIGTMTVKEKEYPHNYPTLIDDFTFQKCQKVMHSKTQKHKKEDTKHSYALKGILKNRATGRLMSGSTTKGNIYYYSPKYGDSPASKNVKEEIILAQIEKVFKSIVIPDEIRTELKERLKNIHESKNYFKEQSIARIKKKYNGIDKKLSNLLNLRIDDSITQKEYDKKATELKQEKKDLELEIKQFDDADEKFAITVQYLLDICSKAHELFISSKPEQKRQLINFVLSNLSLDGERLHYDLNKPFDVIAQSSKSSEWYTR